MPRTGRAWVVAIGISAVCFPPGPASAQASALRAGNSNVARSEQYAAAALEAYQRKAYTEAVTLYERAYALTPNAHVILYNIARVYDVGLGSRRLAIDYYERFIAEAGAAPIRIQSASQRIAELHAAERAAANETAIDELAESGATANAQSAPEADSLVPTPAGSSPSKAATWTTRELAALAAGGVGLASVGFGIGFGLSARSYKDTWEKYCRGNVCSSPVGVDAAESARRQARVATAGMALGGALIGLGSVLWFVDFSRERPGADAALSLVPMASSSDIGGAISGHF
jgi:tetratricopeptide (TPR) repeat protein